METTTLLGKEAFFAARTLIVYEKVSKGGDLFKDLQSMGDGSLNLMVIANITYSLIKTVDKKFDHNHFLDTQPMSDMLTEEHIKNITEIIVGDLMQVKTDETEETPDGDGENK